MTLAITVAAPWGIWQCSDCRLTDTSTHPSTITDDWSAKHISVKTFDGIALITYAGVGAFVYEGERITMAEWVVKQLTGQVLTLQQTYERISEKSTTLFGQDEPVPHGFSIGAFREGVPTIIEISNIRRRDLLAKPHVDRKFVVYERRIDRPTIWYIGSGSSAVNGDDRRLAEIATAVQPERPDDIVELLAAVIQRASQDFSYGKTVSAACHTSWVPPSGAIKGRFFGWGKDHSVETELTPFIMYGINSGEVMEELLRFSQRQRIFEGSSPDRNSTPGIDC